MSDGSFRALGVSVQLDGSLAERGITAPFRIQALVVPDALRGADVLAKSPTGSGKTLAFALPLVERTARDAPAPAVLVLVPTRELASQGARELELLGAVKGLRVAAGYGRAPPPAAAERGPAPPIPRPAPGGLRALPDGPLR